jgi:hypothetical protein
MADERTAAADDEQARPIALGTRLLGDELRRQLVVELVDADDCIPPPIT